MVTGSGSNHLQRGPSEVMKGADGEDGAVVIGSGSNQLQRGPFEV